MSSVVGFVPYLPGLFGLATFACFLALAIRRAGAR